MSLVGALLERRMDVGPFSTIAEPNRTILEAFGGGPVSAGVRVSELIAEGIPTVYGCVDILANTNAQMPLLLMRNMPRGAREAAPDHDVYPLLAYAPNPEMTAFDFRTTMERWKLLWGNAYAQIIRDSAGAVRELWPLRSDRMQVTRDRQNRLLYTYRKADGEKVEFTFDRVAPPIMHLRINSLDGVLGRSPIRVLRESIGWTLATSQFGARFFNNNASPRGILSTEQHFTKEQRDVIRTTWNATHQGVENAHRIAVLEGGLKFAPIGMPLDDAQFIESMKFQVAEISGRIYHVPGFMINDTEKSTSWGSGLEQQFIGFLMIAQMPHLVSWVQSIRRDLLAPSERDHFTAVFLTKALVKADVKTMTEGLRAQINAGILCPDEARAELDMGPRADGRGGEYWQPANITTDSVPAGKGVGDATPPADTDPITGDPVAQTGAAA